MHKRNCGQTKPGLSRAIQSAALAALCAAIAGQSAKAADSPGMVTWSISGSTALKNFTVGIPGTLDGGFSTLETPLTLNLSNGSYDAGTAGLQLAPEVFTGTNLIGSTGAGVRVEYHEAGSVEGVLDLANDQIGYAGGISGTPILDPFTARNPVGGNPIWVNRNRLTGVGTLNGYGIGTSNYNTYDPATYNSAGKNLQGGQNRVQMGISDVVPLQGFSVAGPGTFNATPGSAATVKATAGSTP